MKYLGWKKVVKNFQRVDEERIIDIYVFNNPKLVKYPNKDFIGVRPLNNNYKYWKLIDGALQEKPETGILFGIGINKNRLLD